MVPDYSKVFMREWKWC